MEREELQINDWVRYTDKDGTYNVQVKGITSDVYFRHPLLGEVVFAAPERFEPISLSGKILKGNGFVLTSRWSGGVYENEDETILIDTYEGRWDVNIYIKRERVGEGYVEYVHELQHILNIWKPKFKIEITNN